MAKYTTQIRTIVESGYPLFDFDYPIFDEKYRNVLETKIINRYYFREIGFETVAQFKHFLKMKLNEIMPYYNEHYLALNVFKTYDPYINKDMTTTETRTNIQDSESKTDTTANNTSHGESNSNGTSLDKTKGSSTENGTSSNSEKEVFSDTPQARLSGNEDYATNLTERDGESTNNTTTSQEGESNSTQETTTIQETTDTTKGTANTQGQIKTTDEYIQTIKGFDGMKYASEVYLGVKETIVNFDMQILDELNDLFMNIY